MLRRLDLRERRNHEIGDDETENDPRLREPVGQVECDASAALDNFASLDPAARAGLDSTSLNFTTLERSAKCHLFILCPDPPSLLLWIHRPRQFKRDIRLGQFETLVDSEI